MQLSQNATKGKAKLCGTVLGLDCSTQGLKAMILDGEENVVAFAGVNFDADLPQYKTNGGVYRGDSHLRLQTPADESESALTVSAPSEMFAAALDMVLTKLRDQNVNLSQVRGVSASGQQHGSVWWNKGARAILQSLDAESDLASQLRSRQAFSTPCGPIWMDSSTGRYCQHLEKSVGGAQALADICGSKAYERFTGNQIAKFIDRSAKAPNGGVYAATERIALVSSMVVSLMAGDYAPIDASDGSGMNLLNIRTADWDDRLLAATLGKRSSKANVALLRKKLGPVVPSHTVVGRVCSYFQKKYGFAAQCAVVAASGDNPCSLVGLKVNEVGDTAVSLGTSDTVFGVVRAAEARPSGEDGCVFLHPTDPETAMLMLCFKNGSLTRERVKNHALAKSSDKSWKQFAKMVLSTPAGNNGYMGLFYMEPEITPNIIPADGKPFVRRFNPKGKPVKAFPDAAHECRALLESQLMSYRLYAQQLGLDRPRRVVATGGASADPIICQMLADVFGAPVFTGRGGGAAAVNSAAFGAALRVLHSLQTHPESLGPCSAPCDSSAKSGVQLKFVQTAAPRPEAAAVYKEALPRFRALRDQVIAEAQRLKSKL